MRIGYVMSDQQGQVNETLRTLAEELQAEGRKVCGAVQLNPDDSGERCRIDLRLLPQGDIRCVSQSLGTGADACSLDTALLEQAAHDVALRLAEGAEVLIVNKFGRREAEGGGFRDVVGHAAMAGIPTILGLAEEHSTAFLSFAQDLASPLPADTAALKAWLTKGETASESGS